MGSVELVDESRRGLGLVRALLGIFAGGATSCEGPGPLAQDPPICASGRWAMVKSLTDKMLQRRTTVSNEGEFLRKWWFCASGRRAKNLWEFVSARMNPASTGASRWKPGGVRGSPIPSKCLLRTPSRPELTSAGMGDFKGATPPLPGRVVGKCANAS